MPKRYFTRTVDIPDFICCEVARPQIAALKRVLEKLPMRHADSPPPPDLLERARRALRVSEPVCAALFMPSLLPLHAPVSLAGLRAVVLTADEAIAEFTKRFLNWDSDFEIDVWDDKDGFGMQEEYRFARYARRPERVDTFRRDIRIHKFASRATFSAEGELGDPNSDDPNSDDKPADDLSLDI